MAIYDYLFFKYKTNFWFLKLQLRQNKSLLPVFLIPVVYILIFHGIDLTAILLIILHKTFTNSIEFYRFPKTFNSYFSFFRVRLMVISGFYTFISYNVFLIIGFSIFSPNGLGSYIFHYEILLFSAILAGIFINSFTRKINLRKTWIAFMNALLFSCVIFILIKTLNIQIIK